MVIMPSRKAGVRLAISLFLGSALACNLSLRGDSAAAPQPTASRGGLDLSPTSEPSRTAASTPLEANGPATVDEALADCPATAEIAEVDSKIKISFEADPTAGRLVCTAAAGSADLTREQKNAYNAVLIMKELKFDAPLPWTDKTLYDWFSETIKGIRYRSDIASHSCCGTPPTINIRAELHALYSDRWTAVGALMRLYVHEARHTFMAHRCETGTDRTIAELGAYGVEARLYEWLAYHSDPDFLTMLAPGPGNDYREDARHNFFSLLGKMFCLDPTPTGLPPALSAPADASLPVWTERMIQAARSGIPVPILLTPAADDAVASQGAVFTWQGVDFPGGVTYGIEIDALYAFGKEWTYWQARADDAGLAAPSYTVPLPFDATYSKLGRWRVWAISPSNGAGPKSEWRYFKIG
jgi:hypothetical protein